LDVTDGFRSCSFGRGNRRRSWMCRFNGRKNNMLTAQDNAAIVRAHYEAFNHRDIDKGLSLVTDDVKWMNIPFNTSFSGRKGYREFLENWTTAMPDCKVEIV